MLTAKKVGETPVAFTARIDHQWFGTQFVDQRDFAEDGFGVRVIPCKFNVSIVSKFSAQSVRFVAYLQGNLTSDADGHFTGSVPVTWIRAYSIGARDCTGLIEITDSEAKMTGHLNDDGALEVEVTYLPASLTHKGTCGVSKTTQAMVTPATLSLVVPASGEASTQSQQLNEPTYYTMPGSASIVVMPEQTGSE